MAEAIFRDLVEREGRGDRVQVDSAGLAGWDGSPPHEGTLRVLQEEAGIDASDLRGRRVTAEDLQQFDWILAMDRDNHRQLLELGPAAGQVELMLRFHPGDERLDVPDPFLVGGFEHVYDLLVESCRAFWERVRPRP